MGKKWLIKKTKAEVEADMWKIIERFGTETGSPREVQGGHGRPSFNFTFAYKDKSFGGYSLVNVLKFVDELGYRLVMYRFGDYQNLTLYLEVKGVKTDSLTIVEKLIQALEKGDEQ